MLSPEKIAFKFIKGSSVQKGAIRNLDVMTQYLTYFFTLSFFILLTGCGFHLRGLAPISPALKNLYIDSQGPYGLLEQTFRSTLPRAGIHVTTNPQDATTILVISSENPTQQLLSVGGTQQTRQYNLILTVTFSVTDRSGKVIIPPKVLSETRILTLQSSQILGTTNEQNALYQIMRQAIVYNILNQLSSKKATDSLNIMVSNNTASSS